MLLIPVNMKKSTQWEEDLDGFMLLLLQSRDPPVRQQCILNQALRHDINQSSSNKNKSASAAATPAQTPRTSIHEERPSTQVQTKDDTIYQAMQKVANNSMNSAFYLQ
ncbi:hypothetical protein BCR41DRAFT_421409 [Lobosporangium transversale]|uniref:Uncharacterized protein n=1 Tax=Lobosporangium transversale TaxID=64571 RepID=A0A1Y2GS92_9FUNG|nr:hypothetical protein BCR41DRAFT_421409 [Lobosporangium transversale]ORZ19230.1 hypothetical protein BCR41DRAFT_421409 [Lobosporangium transversale]|eukprot:XP_021882398.1 hypothetical protein BCR41DRAFT_421409 [Lobosporangium transversale]